MSLAFVLIACDTTKQVIQYEEMSLSNDCSELFLENRIKDCNKAMEFMDYHIVPDSSSLFQQSESKYYALVNTIVPGEWKTSSSENIIQLYISKECLKSLTAMEFMSLFLTNADLEKFLEVLKNPKNRLGLDIVIENIGGFSAAFIDSNIVEFAIIEDH